MKLDDKDVRTWEFNLVITYPEVSAEKKPNDSPFFPISIQPISATFDLKVAILKQFVVKVH